MILIALSMTGCVQTGRIAVISSSGFYSAEAENASVTLRSSLRLDRFENNVRPAEAVSYICGEYEHFRTASRLLETDARNVYSATFPSISQRAVWQSNGQVDQGWPAELVKAKGICLRVEAAQMLSTTLATNEVVLPHENEVR
ncbi:hypothetical protein [Brevundimonas pondensis]|uniref:Lipoprotein n=1 Tax=Brevundimonas pondensis TaxID=2774189 RepID=A0ABX7SHG0_9CAUL|nr:hypothetical protein [Brevundimonas pondensis]QTC87087.1 hypothetical protein IFE19_13305 [Brevundimonas pondensis]